MFSPVDLIALDQGDRADRMRIIDRIEDKLVGPDSYTQEGGGGFQYRDLWALCWDRKRCATDSDREWCKTAQRSIDSLWNRFLSVS